MFVIALALKRPPMWVQSRTWAASGLVAYGSPELFRRYKRMGDGVDRECDTVLHPHFAH
jgi:hypothetical protein